LWAWGGGGGGSVQLNGTSTNLFNMNGIKELSLQYNFGVFTSLGCQLRIIYDGSKTCFHNYKKRYSSHAFVSHLIHEQ